MGTDIFSLSGSSGGGDDGDLSKINIDKDYAKRFEHNKKREALQKLQELKKKGLAGADDSSDEDSDDDDDAELVEPEKDLKFYDALVKVKNQDPVLLAKEVKLFEEESDSDAEEEEKKEKPKKKERPMYLKDVNAKHLMEEGPEFGLKHDRKIYNKDQVADIKAFLEAEKAAFGADDDDGEDLIKEKDRKGDGDEMEEEEDENAGKIDKRLDEFFGDDGNLDEGEKFLKNYLRNQMWVDKEKDNRAVLDDIDVSDDEEALEEQEKYEAEYNFRHEEVEGDRILGHARFTEGSVRIKNSSRKVQRKSKEERMAQAELERKQELKHLKNLKKKEIQEKLEKIRAIAGIGEGEGCKLDADDLEEEFDPEEYDRKMKEVFDVDYYGKEDADPGFGSDEEGNLEKPDFDKEDELLGLPKDWDVAGTKEGFEAARERVLKRKQEVKEPVGDEDEDEDEDEESKRKKKRKMTLKEKVELDKEFEEYYKLDYEDTIGDLKTRFKYRSVKPSKFGLRTEEVLMADDKNLNQYVSLKKLAPYMEKDWKVTYHQKLKKPLILQLDGDVAGKKYDPRAGPSNSGKQKKSEDVESNGEANGTSRRSRRRQRQAELKLSRSRLMAYGKIPSKPQKKH
ncbi:protein KRI1-like protein [Iris pallida]|uniref:Protein KRI1-like protein n=1 Tax=Iris pallida TaxID=29817 RepID=A0AAX6ERK7_IRIPA|nr:protein KRI1-like protein [Iris pallida]